MRWLLLLPVCGRTTRPVRAPGLCCPAVRVGLVMLVVVVVVAVVVAVVVVSGMVGGYGPMPGAKRDYYIGIII